jgi:hypothetical protein
MAQRVRITIDADVPDSVKQEELAERLGALLERSGLKVALHGDTYATEQVPIKSVGARAIGDRATGYETRIWEKATCRWSEFDPGRVEDVIINPRVNIDFMSGPARNG